MLFACGIVAFAFASTAFSLKDQHLSTIVEYMIAFLVIVLGAHLAIRRWAPYADPLLLPIATVLNGLGIVMIYRLNQAGRDGNASASGGPISTLSHSRPRSPRSSTRCSASSSSWCSSRSSPTSGACSRTPTSSA